jgi:hypothetical protein
MPLIQEDAPHPLSYRPDLPLRSELDKPLDETSYDAGHQDGYEEGRDAIRHIAREAEEDLEEVQAQLENARREIATLKGVA